MAGVASEESVAPEPEDAFLGGQREGETSRTAQPSRSFEEDFVQAAFAPRTGVGMIRDTPPL